MREDGHKASMLLTFLIVSVALTALPGPECLLAIRNGLRGRRQAIAVGAGTAVAALGCDIAAAFELAVVLQQSAIAFGIVKLGGAAYLVGLGLWTLWSTLGAQTTTHGKQDTTPVPRTTRAALRTGLIAGLLNPKVGLLYVAVPQLIPKTDSVVSSTLLFSSVDAVVVDISCGMASLSGQDPWHSHSPRGRRLGQPSPGEGATTEKVHRTLKLYVAPDLHRSRNAACLAIPRHT
jgi:threonine/homoserine/homoserine lactone efflux protein